MTCEETGGQAQSMADAVARRSYGKLVAFLAALTRDVAAAEDALADAFAAALADWPGRGCPANPEAWLVTVARRKIIDEMRRRCSGAMRLKDVAERAKCSEGMLSKPLRLTSNVCSTSSSVIFANGMRCAMPAPAWVCCSSVNIGRPGFEPVKVRSPARQQRPPTFHGPLWRRQHRNRSQLTRSWECLVARVLVNHMEDTNDQVVYPSPVDSLLSSNRCKLTAEVSSKKYKMCLSVIVTGSSDSAYTMVWEP